MLYWYLLTARKGSGFTPVCHSVHREVGRSPSGQRPPSQKRHPVAATAAVSTHATGIHSC